MRVLLLEDEAVSRRFLETVVGTRVSVDSCADCANALLLAREIRYAALLLDLHLPDGDGVSWLAQLRGEVAAASRDSPALALTAELDGERERQLRAAGFAAALQKPIDATTLWAALQPWLPETQPEAVWDDAAALRAVGGRAANVAALRQLLRKDLADQRDKVLGAWAAGNHDAMRGELHRLRAAAGFCGAAELGAAAIGLAADASEAARQRFVDACAQILRKPEDLQ